MIVFDPKRVELTPAPITGRTRSKDPIPAEPLVTPESREKETSGNKVKKKDDIKSPSNAETRAETLKHRKDALAKILSDKVTAAGKEKEKVQAAKLAADREKKAIEGKEKNTETPDKKRRQQKTRDKDRLTVDTGEPGDKDAQVDDEAMLSDDDAWKTVAKNGKGKTKKQREEAAEKKKAKKEAKQAAKALKASQAAELAAKEVASNSNKGKTGTPKAGNSGPTRKKDSQYSTCFILNVGGREGATIPEVQKNAMKAVFSVGNDIEEICFEPLSSSIAAPLLYSEADTPTRATLQRNYIRVVSGGGNVNKPGKRVGFVVRLAHNEAPATLAQAIRSDMQNEFGVSIYAKRLNLPHTTSRHWLKGILVDLPANAVQDQIVSDLIACGFPGTAEHLCGKINLEAKNVWISEKAKEIEKKAYNAQALAFIDTHGKQYHIECCNSIREDVTKYLDIYKGNFCARWGPKAEIRTMPTWEPKDFGLTISNGKKRTQAIAFNAQVVS